MTTNIRERPKDIHREKEVKVKIPVTFHVKLQAVKIMMGKQISETVVEALEDYFRRLGYADPGGVSEVMGGLAADGDSRPEVQGAVSGVLP